MTTEEKIDLAQAVGDMCAATWGHRENAEAVYRLCAMTRHLSAENEAMRAGIAKAAEEMEMNGLDIDTLAPFLPKPDKLLECLMNSDPHFSEDWDYRAQANALRTAILAAGGRDPFGDEV